MINFKFTFKKEFTFNPFSCVGKIQKIIFEITKMYNFIILFRPIRYSFRNRRTFILKLIESYQKMNLKTKLVYLFFFFSYCL